MLSMDTNLLFHAFNKDSPAHTKAYSWLASIQGIGEVAISEFILAEFYALLRNPAVLTKPLKAREAVEVIQAYRLHPRWRLIGFSAESRPLHDQLWQKAGTKDFAFRRIYDTRSALSMIAQGVKVFATLNVKDYEGMGFQRVWNPLKDD